MNYSRVAWPVLAGLLASCASQTTPTATTPAPAQGGLYTLSFQGIGSGNTTVTAQSASRRLSSQTLADVPEPLGIERTPVATSTFVTTKDGVSTRHIQVTFRVTNTTAQTQSNLVLAPVITADTDGNPANNAQAPTVAGTPFRDVRFFDGSDASSAASQLILTQGKTLQGTQPALNPAQTPYFESLDTSTLTPAPPAGLSATVMKSGWLAAQKLAPGASVDVTFAVDLRNVDVNDSRAQPYSFNLLFTAGQDQTASTVGSSTDAGTIQGSITGWKYGQAKLTGQYGGAAIGMIGTDGAVNVKLPTPDSTQLSALLQGCTLDGTFTSPGIKTSSPYLPVYSLQDDYLGRMSEAIPGSDWRVRRLYSDSRAVLKGLASCPNSLPSLSAFDLDLQQGWNVVQWQYNSASDRLEMKSVTPGTPTQLAFTLVRPGVYLELTDQPPYSSLSLRAGESQSFNAVFRQNGAISGDITLDTDVPGVTIEPSAVTLPSLAVQSKLNAQALARSITIKAADDMQAYYGPVNIIIRQGGQEVGRYSASLQVVVPYVSAYILDSYNTRYLSQGSTQSIPVSVSSQNSFSGPASITLTGLPAGVTASTETVTLTPGANTTVNVQLSATRDAALSTFTAQLSGTKVQMMSPGVPVAVTPLQTPVNLDQGSQVVTTTQGTWVMGMQGGTRTFVRMLNGAEVQRETISAVDTYSPISFSAAADGRLMVVHNVDVNPDPYTVQLESAIVRIGLDGTRSQQQYAPEQVGDFMNLGAFDSAGNFWFLRLAERGQASAPTELVRLDPAGTFTTVRNDLPNLYSGSTRPLLVSADRKTLSFELGGQYYFVESATAAVSSIPAVSYFTPGALSNDGVLFGTQGARVFQVNRSGQQSAVYGTENLDYFNVVGVDLIDSNILWLRGSYSIARVNMVTGESRNIQFGPSYSARVVQADLNAGGGITVLLEGSAPGTSSLSILK